jgi:hypothetical protein
MAKREAGARPKKPAAKKKAAKAKGETTKPVASAKAALNGSGSNFRPPTNADQDLFLKYAKQAETQWKNIDKAMTTLQREKQSLGEIYTAAKAAGVPSERVKQLKKTIAERKRDAAEVLVEERERAWQHTVMKSEIREVLPFEHLMKPPSLKEIEMQGEHAGKNGEPPDNNPWTPGTPQYVAWAGGQKKGHRDNVDSVFKDKGGEDGGDGPQAVE